MNAVKRTAKDSILIIPLRTLLLCLTACFFLATWLISMNKARIENAAIVSYKGEREAIVLPFYSDNQEPGNILFSFTLINSRLFSGTLRILPDDCITRSEEHTSELQ